MKLLPAPQIQNKSLYLKPCQKSKCLQMKNFSFLLNGTWFKNFQEISEILDFQEISIHMDIFVVKVIRVSRFSIYFQTD